MPTRFLLTLLTTFFVMIPAVAKPQQKTLQDVWQRMPIPKSPQRILSLAPASTEILFAIGAQAKVVGVTDDCNYPKAAQRKPKVGRFGNILLEKILKTRPDLIVVTADMQSRLEPLRALSIPVLALETRHLNDVFANIELLGQLTGKQTVAHKKVNAWKKQLPVSSLKNNAPRVFYMVWHDPLMTASSSSFIGNVIVRAGGKNVVTAKSPFLRYGTEKLLKSNPDVLIMPKSLSQQINLNQAPYAYLKAIKNERVLVLEDDLISRPGPRIFETLITIHRFLKKGQ